MSSSQDDQRIFGRYEIRRRLAVGGMGEIFLAVERRPDGSEQLAILKSLLPDLAEQPEFVTQFLDEARLAATLSHRNIVSMWEAGEWQGAYYLAMEYIHGESAATLQALAKRAGTRLPLALAVRLVYGAAVGLDHAHHAVDPDGRPLRLVHRDVSPQNLMVGIDGVTKVVDFGVARASGRLTRTATGLVKGKLPYMAPEHVGGKPIDGRADQFGLGAVLWELIVGRRLFAGENDAKVLQAVLRDPIVRPSVIIQEVSPALDAVVMRMLARDPLGRFALMADVARALAPVVAAFGEEASEATLGRYVQKVAGDRLRQKLDEGAPTPAPVAVPPTSAPGSRAQVPGWAAAAVEATAVASPRGRRPAPVAPAEPEVAPTVVTSVASTSRPPAALAAPIAQAASGSHGRVATRVVVAGAVLVALALGFGLGLARRSRTAPQAPAGVVEVSRSLVADAGASTVATVATESPAPAAVPESAVSKQPAAASAESPSPGLDPRSLHGALVTVRCGKAEAMGFFVDPLRVVAPAHAACPVGEGQQVVTLEGVPVVGTTLSRDDWAGVAQLKVIGVTTQGLRVRHGASFAAGTAVSVPRALGSSRPLTSELLSGIEEEQGVAVVRATVVSAPAGAPVLDADGAVLGMVREGPDPLGGPVRVLPAEYLVPPAGEAKAAWAERQARLEVTRRETIKELRGAQGRPYLLAADTEAPFVFLLVRHFTGTSPTALPFELTGTPACALQATVDGWKSATAEAAPFVGGHLVRAMAGVGEAREPLRRPGEAVARGLPGRAAGGGRHAPTAGGDGGKPHRPQGLALEVRAHWNGGERPRCWRVGRRAGAALARGVQGGLPAHRRGPARGRRGARAAPDARGRGPWWRLRGAPSAREVRAGAEGGSGGGHGRPLEAGARRVHRGSPAGVAQALRGRAHDWPDHSQGLSRR
ncbi:MAG: serine/threonine-protein kinase [Myxococcales bacterium]